MVLWARGIAGFAAWAREVKINMCAHSCTCMQFALCHRLQAVSSTPTRGGAPTGLVDEQLSITLESVYLYKYTYGIGNSIHLHSVTYGHIY